MRRAREDTIDAAGHDSFLDIVANMVGIMILLIMVMGVRASHEASGLTEKLANTSAKLEKQVTDDELKQAFKDATNSQKDVHQLVQRMVDVHGEAALREQERNYLSTYLAAFEQELHQRRDQLGVEEQRDYDLRRQLVTAQLTLDNLAREQVALLGQPTEVEEVESLPTPLAETVSGNEVHLRLADGHVAFIPLDQLREKLKEHAEANLWRLRNQDSIVETFGPIGGFRLRYRLDKGRFTVSRELGVTSTGTWVRFSEWELLPESQRMGEPVDQAVLASSDLWYHLKRYRPESTVVTIWTYPGSFSDFRRLKQELFEAGYATAARPLPSGVLIAGSPRGSKSAAQ